MKAEKREFIIGLSIEIFFRKQQQKPTIFFRGFLLLKLL